MSLGSRLVHLLDRRFGITVRRSVQDRVLDRSFHVIRGSVRTPDYDDAWLFALGLRSSVIFDIGCNMGQSSLLLLWSDAVERIVLVDASPKALSVAADNLIVNGLASRATFVGAFVSDEADRSVRFHSVGVGGAGSLYAEHARTAADLGAAETVATTTVDELARDLGLAPDLIKVDVEGAEGLVLRGAVDVARHGATRFLVEMHSNPSLSMARNADEVLAWCRETEYRAWYLAEMAELTTADPIAERGRCHLLLQPAAMPLPGYLRPLEQGAPLERVEIPESARGS